MSTVPNVSEACLGQVPGLGHPPLEAAARETRQGQAPCPAPVREGPCQQLLATEPTFTCEHVQERGFQSSWQNAI